VKIGSFVGDARPADASRRAVWRQSASIAGAVAPFGVAFGAAGSQGGLSLWQTVGFSLFVFAGSAQFAAVAILGDGGSAAAAIASGLLLNLRSVAFGLAIAKVLPRRPWKRAVASHLMIDETAAVASAQSDPVAMRYGYLVAGSILYLVWNVSTLVGATVVGSATDTIDTLGIDATIPAAFLALLWPRLADPRQRLVAILGAAIAVALTPFLPPGIPVIAAILAIVPARPWR
jgi:4-azaleucine resistance transporter AzlC